MYQQNVNKVSLFLIFDLLCHGIIVDLPVRGGSDESLVNSKDWQRHDEPVFQIYSLLWLKTGGKMCHSHVVYGWNVGE